MRLTELEATLRQVSLAEIERLGIEEFEFELAAMQAYVTLGKIVAGEEPKGGGHA